MKKRYWNNFFMSIMAATTLCLAVPAQAGIFDNLMSNVLGIKSPELRLELYGQVDDKPLVNAFYTLSEDGKNESIPERLTRAGFEFEGLNGTMISMRRHLTESANMSGATDSLAVYQTNADADEIAQTYVAFAATRGNVVKVYQPRLGDRLSAGFKMIGMNPDAKRREFHGYDRVLIEFDNSGHVVSFINRALQAITTIGVGMYQYTGIYSGKRSVRHLENNISLSDMEKFYIRTLEPLPNRVNLPIEPKPIEQPIEGETPKHE